MMKCSTGPTETRGARPEEDFHPMIERTMIRLVLGDGYASSTAGYVLAVALAVVLQQVMPGTVFWGWLGVSTVVFLARLAATSGYFRAVAQEIPPEKIGAVALYKALLYVTGAVWGIGVFFYFPTDSAAHQMPVIVIMAGLAAGAVPILSPFIRIYYAYVSLFLLPLAVLFFRLGGELYTVLAVLVMLFNLVLINSAKRMHDALLATLENRFRNEALIKTLQEANEAAQAASKAKNEFLANMSHEIRTPMNGVLGTLQLLRESRMDRSQEDLVETAYGSAESLLHLLNDILDFSKIEAGKLRFHRAPFSLRGLVNELEQRLGHQLGEKNLAFAAEIDPRLPRQLVGDPDRIRQILNNFLSNAVKFTEQGRVTVRAAPVEQIADQLVVRLEVIDTGIGIAEPDQKKLFQSFTQGDSSLTRKYGGAGLGIAIVRQLVELMDGCCGVQSAKGEGSRFWCEIPFGILAEPAQGASTKQAEPLSAQVALTGNVLLVEDNLVNRKIAKGMLQKFGLTVNTAGNGQEALEALRQQSFAAVLMDCQMPVLDGYAATTAWREEEARERHTRTPIIAMTAHAMEGDREKCLAAGMDDYLAKPVKMETLAAMLEKWLPPGRHDR